MSKIMMKILGYLVIFCSLLFFPITVYASEVTGLIIQCLGLPTLIVGNIWLIMVLKKPLYAHHKIGNSLLFSMVLFINIFVIISEVATFDKQNMPILTYILYGLSVLSFCIVYYRIMKSPSIC